MDKNEDINNLSLNATDLNGTLAQTTVLVAGFDGELRRMRTSLAATGKDVATLEKGLSKGLRKAFDGVVFDGMKLSDALRTVAQSLVNTTYNAAIRPVTNHFGGLISQGVNGLMQGILPFAKGGVVSSATAFPMRGGMGLMGEAGPEAILPLARGPDGKLGVKSGGGGGATVVMNISTPDVQSFQRSQSQIAAQMSRALSSGNRNR